MQMLSNPATRSGAPERKRIPMSVPIQRLSVPEIEGYHTHWFRGEPARIMRAQQAGYEFVSAEEIALNDVGLGGTSTRDGNTDLGSQVSVISGKEVDTNGQPLHLILMKIRQELRNEDLELQQQQHDRTRASLLGGLADGTGGDPSNRYVDQKRTSIPDFFKRKAR